MAQATARAPRPPARVMQRYGLRTKRAAIELALRRLDVEPMNRDEALAMRGAALYRACRRSGTTIRRLPDCLIATVVIRNRAELLHCDSDFDAIARHSPLAIVPLAAQAS